jgi:hypothetical protein
MGMERARIDAVAAVLQRWNPLGLKAADYQDLNANETEAIDIISNFSLARQGPESVVRSDVNQAFDLCVILVSVASDRELDRLAKAGRALKGHAQTQNSGADIFLASPDGQYIGRTCGWRECRPGM